MLKNLQHDRALFLDGCARLGLSLTPEQLEKIDTYVALLLKWQAHINLIGPQTTQAPYTRHVLDSLQLIPLLKPTDTVVDFGSGGGMPSVLIAIMTPCMVKAIERNGKKCQFLNQARLSCKLNDNFSVDNRDIRALASEKTLYSVVTARAFAELKVILELAEPITNASSRYLLLKGARFNEEILSAKEKFRMTFETKQSITDSEGKVLVITSVSRETE